MRRRLGTALLLAVPLATALPAVMPAGLSSNAQAKPAARTQMVARSAQTKIRHVFVIIQEGRSFDNYFGTFPGALGLSKASAVPSDPTDPTSSLVKPHLLKSLRTAPLDDSVNVATAASNGGKMNGFVAAQTSAGGNGGLAMGHYDATQIPYYWQLARSYVLADHFFSSTLGGSTSNYEYAVAAQSWPSASAGGPSAGQQTIFGRLSAAGVSWGYFVRNYNADRKAGRLTDLHAQVPLLDLTSITENPKQMSHIQDLSDLYRQLDRGGLPAVSYVVQPGETEHAPGSVAAGEVATVGMINTIMRSRYWNSSAIFLTWSDWGGWYDGVAPPQVDGTSYGFRVPALIISPYVRQGLVLHNVADFTSILKFIETVYGVAPLTSRDKGAYDLLGAFDFSHPPRPPTPIAMGTLPSTTATQGSLPVIFAAYGAVALMVLLLFGYAVSSWLLTGDGGRRQSGST